MSAPKTTIALTRVALVAAAALTVSGCAYDYLQRTDRVAYSAGDAVRANIERETTNPSSPNMNDVSDLGSYGTVVDAEGAVTEPTPVPVMTP